MSSSSLCRYKRFKAPRYCTNATTLGTCKVQEGDFIFYKEHYADDAYRLRFARVLGLATHDGCGEQYMSELEGEKPKPEPRLMVMALSDNFTHAYERHVKLGDVYEILSRPSERFRLLRWMLFGQAPTPEQAVRFMNHGSCCDSYIQPYLTGPEGSLREDWFEVFMKRTAPTK